MSQQNTSYTLKQLSRARSAAAINVYRVVSETIAQAHGIMGSHPVAVRIAPAPRPSYDLRDTRAHPEPGSLDEH